MLCENCLNRHNGDYGSGRFCSKKCAKGYATKAKRAEINKTVSQTLTGRKSTGKPFQSGFDKRRKTLTSQDRQKAIATLAEKRLSSYKSSPFNELPLAEKRRVLINRQEGKCAECGLQSWQGKPITLELHHINGIHGDDREENLIFLCPNCHSQTDNFRNKKRVT